MALLIGDSIEGKLVEEVEKNLWIVSIGGTLLQVKNTSELNFKKDKKVKLQLVQDKPMQFIILGLAKRSSRRFQVRV